jgi:DNA replication and repair protein RecF
LTIVIGPNTAGKTNILEAVYLLATGRSFRAGVEREMISHEQEIARVSSKFQISNSKKEGLELEIVLTTGFVQGKQAPYKRYLVNGIGRRKSDFVGNFYAVLFNPQDIELVTDSPGRRRAFLDNVLVQTSKSYARALTEYEKALRRRNKILADLSEKRANPLLRSSELDKNRHGQLEYWDKLLVEKGRVITRYREKFVKFLNSSGFAIQDSYVRKKSSKNTLGKFGVEYRKSEVSEERLEEYAKREAAAGYTLIGPHRDDFGLKLKAQSSKLKSTTQNLKLDEDRDISIYGSRGEQRLAVLWLKLGELEYLKEKTGEKPVLLLDDIFSELDHEHRRLVQKIIPDYQTIITAADKHYVEGIVVDSEGTQIIRL